MTEIDRQFLEACDRYILAKEEGRRSTTEYRKMRAIWSKRVRLKAAQRRAAQKVAA